MSNTKVKKERADQLLVQKGLIESRSKAQSFIMAGSVEYKKVSSDFKSETWCKIDKAGEAFLPDVEMRILDNHSKDVGRGAQKMRRSFEYWPYLNDAAQNALALDIGSSTGGFTQVLLEKGARQVVALDVGTHQLHERLRADSRVLSLEQTHVLKIDRDFFRSHGVTDLFDFLVMDVSFISSTKVIPHAAPWMKVGAYWVILVKPQFELDAKKVPRGIVKNPDHRKEALDSVIGLARSLDCFNIEGHCESPISGADGNVEYLLCLKKL